MKDKKANKIVRGWSLSEGNIKWLKERAQALSTPERRISDSQFLDDLISEKREEQARHGRILNAVQKKARPV